MRLGDKIKFFSPVILTAVFVLIFLGVFIDKSPVESGPNPEVSYVRGQALWNNSHGYVYFNCSDYMVGERLDASGNFTDGFQFSYNACDITGREFGVQIDEDNNFQGEAWSPVDGFISFKIDKTPEDEFRRNCPSSCEPGRCSACYNPENHHVYGYAEIAETRQVIKLHDEEEKIKPVMIQSYDLEERALLPGSSVVAGDFVFNAQSNFEKEGRAILSFNCESADPGGLQDCANSSNYKVFISNLRLGALSSPNMDYVTACLRSGRQAVLDWFLSSGQMANYDPATNLPLSYETTQNAYEIVVMDRDSSSPNLESNICYSGLKNSTADFHILNEASCRGLDYNKNYYWWIRLYGRDDRGEVITQWYQFGNPDNNIVSFSTDGDPDSNPKTFTTYKHDFPDPFFIWSPPTIIVGTTTLFTSQSYFYGSSGGTGGGTPIGTRRDERRSPCSRGYCSYLWSLEPITNGTISSTTNATTSIVFGHATGTMVWLRVMDNDGYYCSTSTTINANYEIPIWRETKPQ